MQMKTICLTLFLFLSAAVNAQDFTAQAAQITAEGKKLYRLERASWVGTDVMQDRLKEKEQLKVGGYVSYKDGDRYTCVFFTSSETAPKVLYSVSFDTTYNIEKAVIWSGTRDLTEPENELFQLRQKTIGLVKLDKFFEREKGTTFNIVPIIEGDKREVYILTATNVSGQIFFGTDYYISFDATLGVTSKKAFHKSFVQVSSSGGKDAVTVHEHDSKTEELITATDICTLMLYHGITRWSQHIVIGKNYVSMWDCKKKTLTIITAKEFKKISKELIGK